MNKERKRSDELAKTLWGIANELRGNMDANEFKNYILGLIFYRTLCEREDNYMKDLLKDDDLTYAEALEDKEYADTVKRWSLDHLGYIIYPENSWNTLIKKMKTSTFSVEDLEKAIKALTSSTIGEESEAAFRGLFDDVNLKSDHLGREVSDRTRLISKVMLKINNCDFHEDDDKFHDYLGTAYMQLIGLFQSNGGKKAGEYYTPHSVSELTVRLALVHAKGPIYRICDPCAGSGSLLLEVSNWVPDKNIHFYAQELNSTTYNLLRMNLIMHGIPYKQFTVFNDDTLRVDNMYENGRPIKFEIQVTNPPYSAVNTACSDDYLNDSRYSSCGTLAPKTKADLQFILQLAYHMKDGDTAAVLLPLGVLFRKNGEEKIRKYLIDKLNVVDAIIGLPENVFHGTSIPVACIVLRKGREKDDKNIMFIDASKEFISGKPKNSLSKENIDKILKAYTERKDIDQFANVIPIDKIRESRYDCNITNYVSSSESEPEVDIFKTVEYIKDFNKDIASTEKELRSMFATLGIEFPDI